MLLYAGSELPARVVTTVPSVLTLHLAYLPSVLRLSRNNNDLLGFAHPNFYC